MDDHFCPDTIPVPTLDIKDRRIYKCLVVHKRHRPPEVLAGRHITDVCKIRIGAAQRDPQVRHVSACDAMGRRDVEVAINDVFRNNRTEFVNKFLIALNTCRFALGKLIMGPLQKSLSSTSTSNFERKTADATMFTCKVSGGAGAVL